MTVATWNEATRNAIALSSSEAGGSIEAYQAGTLLAVGTLPDPLPSPVNGVLDCPVPNALAVESGTPDEIRIRSAGGTVVYDGDLGGLSFPGGIVAGRLVRWGTIRFRVLGLARSVREVTFAATGRTARVRLIEPTEFAGAVHPMFWAHGFTASHLRYTPIAEDLAANGYAVAQIEFPDSDEYNTSPEGGPPDDGFTYYPSRILELEELASLSDAGSLWSGVVEIDGLKKLVGGHSYGAGTAIHAAGATYYLPPPGSEVQPNVVIPGIRGCVALSPQGLASVVNDDPASWSTFQCSLLSMTGTNDPGRPGPGGVGGEDYTWRFAPHLNFDTVGAIGADSFLGVIRFNDHGFGTLTESEQNARVASWRELTLRMIRNFADATCRDDLNALAYLRSTAATEALYADPGEYQSRIVKGGM